MALFTHQAHALVERRPGAGCDRVRREAGPAPQRDVERDDVREAGRRGQHLAPATADDDRRAGDVRVGRKGPDALDRRLESSQSIAERLHLDPCGLEVGLEPTGPEPELQASPGDHLQRARLLRNHRRVAELVAEHVGRKCDPTRLHRGRSEQEERRAPVVEVVTDADARVAEVLGATNERDEPVAIRAPAHRRDAGGPESDAKSHRRDDPRMRHLSHRQPRRKAARRVPSSPGLLVRCTAVARARG